MSFVERRIMLLVCKLRPLKKLNRKYVSQLGLCKHKYCTIAFRTNQPAEDVTPPISKESKIPHIPVMKDEILNFLEPKPNQVFLDMTFGAGGHSKCLLDSNSGISLYGLDRDPLAYQFATELAQTYTGLTPLLGRFSELPYLFNQRNVPENSLDGIMLDAGTSSMQFDVAERGFAISQNGPLDMRMDNDRFPNTPTAADVINALNATQLAKIFKTYGEEKKSKKIAQAIIDARYMMKEIKTTKELVALVASVFDDDYERSDKLKRFAHPATKVFQALRIFVNNELNELNYGMEVALRYLKPGIGKLAVLTFHSLEDRIVKRHLHDVDVNAPNMYLHKYRNSSKVHTQEELDKIIPPKSWIQINNHVITPSDKEVFFNPRSRSAKLRLAVKV